MMMQKDEENALSKLSHFEQTIKSETSNFDGEIVKMYGDGSLVLFSSALKALNCAINIQKSLRNDPKVPLRIGILIGEIVRKNNDIFGNGVNVASRIESVGSSNSVLISSDLYLQIKNHPKITTQKLGSFIFKNVDRMIDLYAVTNDNLSVPMVKEMNGKGKIVNTSSIFSKFWTKFTLLLITFLGVAFIYNISISTPAAVKKDLTTNLKALNFYLKGEFHHNKQTLSDIDTAITYYNKAIKNDSKFAQAYNGLSKSYMRKFLSFESDTKWEKEAYSTARIALSLNPKLAYPHIILGQFYWSKSYNFAHEEAIKEFTNAIIKSPKLSTGYE